MSDSNQAYNIWGVVASVLSTLGLLSMVWDLFKSQMPTQKLRKLEDDLRTTYQLLNDNVEEGLLDPERFRPRMRIIKHRIDDLRSHVFTAVTWQEELRNWRRGLSAQLNVLLREVYKIRATIAKSNSEERRKLSRSEGDGELVLRDQALGGTDIAVPAAEQAPPESTSTTSFTDVQQQSPSPSHDGRVPPLQQSCSTLTTSTAPACIDNLFDDPHTLKTLPRDHPGNDADAEVRPPRALDRPRDQKAWKKRPPSRRDVLLQFGRQLMKPSSIHSRTANFDVLSSPIPKPGRKKHVLRVDSFGDGARPKAKRSMIAVIVLPGPYTELCDDYEGDDESD
ncbi:hypothetical protein VTO73DRAFT_2248 [Trametes versicolor]